MTDFYRTLAEPCGPLETKEKGSRFLAFASPAATMEDAERFVATLKRRFHDASHIGWACRTGDGEEHAFRYSDGGEPAGTAGAPIYQEMTRIDLLNAVCAVVRYFGGVKLGTGGLSRAFSGAARALLSSAPLRMVPVTELFVIDAPFDCVGAILHLTKQYAGGEIISREYPDAAVRLTVAIPRSQAAEFVACVTDKSNGRAVVSLNQRPSPR